MLNGGFREASPATQEIPLPDDDADALYLLLQVAHLKFKELPKSLSIQELYRISVVCDKYDAAGAFRPFIGKYTGLPLCGFWRPEYGEQLHIAWTFGMKEEAQRAARMVILYTKLIDGDLTYSNRSPVLILPPNASGTCYNISNHSYYRGIQTIAYQSIEYIKPERSRIINELIALVNAEFTIFCSGNSAQQSINGDQCRLYKLGYMIEYLYRCTDFKPRTNEVSDFDSHTIVEATSSLADCVMKECHEQIRKPSGGRRPRCGRCECSTEAEEFRDKIKSIIDSPVTLPENMLAHIERQAKQ
jgi:hypothetical protein